MASDPLATVISVLLERGTCMACLVVKTGLTPRQVGAALGRTEKVLHIDTIENGYCDSCRTITALVSAHRRV